MKNLIKTVPILFSILLIQGSQLEQYRSEVEEWEESIKAFESLDRTETYSDDSLLFVGSSSILLWSTIAEDMAPYPVIQRGFGGSRLSDVAWYAKRLIYPHEFKALVMFVANDISGNERDKSPDEVGRLLKYILDVVREKYPETPFFYIEITPTAKRWDVWPQIREANRILKAVCDGDPNAYFISTSRHYLRDDGIPNPALFREDELHLNRAGYLKWNEIIKAAIHPVLGSK
jgi:lysophospholipase L1-like esterase